jgi:hypothetical protein
MNEAVVRRVVRKLTLWDARAAQAKHPDLAAAVAEEVHAAFDRALRTPPPGCVRAWLASSPGRRTRRHGNMCMMRTPRDLAVHWAREGVCVTFYKSDADAHGRLDLRVVDPTRRPTFHTLRCAAAPLAWFASGAATLRVAAVVRHPAADALLALLAQFTEPRLAQSAAPLGRRAAAPAAPPPRRAASTSPPRARGATSAA